MRLTNPWFLATCFAIAAVVSFVGGSTGFGAAYVAIAGALVAVASLPKAAAERPARVPAPRATGSHRHVAA